MLALTVQTDAHRDDLQTTRSERSYFASVRGDLAPWRLSQNGGSHADT